MSGHSRTGPSGATSGLEKAKVVLASRRFSIVFGGGDCSRASAILQQAKRRLTVAGKFAVSRRPAHISAVVSGRRPKQFWAIARSGRRPIDRLRAAEWPLVQCFMLLFRASRQSSTARLTRRAATGHMKATRTDWPPAPPRDSPGRLKWHTSGVDARHQVSWL